MGEVQYMVSEAAKRNGRGRASPPLLGEAPLSAVWPD